MSLKTKLSLIISSVFIVLLFVEYSIQRHIIIPSFTTLEHLEANKSMERAVKAIEKEIFYLDVLCHDWAAWNETYEFANTRAEEFIEDNIPFSAFDDNNLNLVWFVDEQGGYIWGQIYNLDREEEIELTSFPIDTMPKKDPLLSFDIGSTPLSELAVTGIYMTEAGPMFVASRPILTNNIQGPSRGALILGRFLDQKIVRDLATQTQVSFDVYPVKSDRSGINMTSIENDFTKNQPYKIVNENVDRLSVFGILRDLEDEPALMIEAKIPRVISKHGNTTVRYAMLSNAIVGLLVLAIVIFMLQKLILSPIKHLSRHALDVGKSKNLKKQLNLNKKDEIGILGNEFDKMIAQLDGVNGKLKREIALRIEVEEERKNMESQLLRAHKLEAVGQLAAGIAHEINTPAQYIG